MDISSHEGSGPSDNQPGPELLLSNPEYAWACLPGTPILSTAVQEKWELGVTGAACTGSQDQDLAWPFRDNLPIPLEPSHISKGNFGSSRDQCVCGRSQGITRLTPGCMGGPSLTGAE